MGKSPKQQPGRSVAVRAGAALVAALAVVCVNAGPGRAAGVVPAEAAECTVSDPVDGWVTTRCDGSTDEEVSRTWTLGWLQTVNSIDGRCGVSDGYRLVDESFSPGRIIPYGVEISEPGGVGASGLPYSSDGVAAGIEDLSMTNWSSNTQSVTVVLHCTTNSSSWYGLDG